MCAVAYDCGYYKQNNADLEALRKKYKKGQKKNVRLLNYWIQFFGLPPAQAMMTRAKSKYKLARMGKKLKELKQ